LVELEELFVLASKLHEFGHVLLGLIIFKVLCKVGCFKEYRRKLLRIRLLIRGWEMRGMQDWCWMERVSV
jgi:hypothetical protein